MRNAFIQALHEVARADERVMLLTADLGYKLFDDFRRDFPGRYLNLGVCEANMVNVAAGLALSGRRPFVYSIVPFSTIRCLDQIRCAASMSLPIIVVGVGAGFAYGLNGPTHYGVDDIAVMRPMPGMTVISPCDPVEVALAVRAVTSLSGPAYLRLGRAGDPELQSAERSFTLGVPSVLREGRDVAFIACGSVAVEALGAAERLARQGLDPLVLSAHTIKMGGVEIDFLAGRKLETVFVVEEHGPAGGLFESISASLASAGARPRLVRISTPEVLPMQVGSQAWMRRATGLDAESIYSAAMRVAMPKVSAC